VLGSQDLISVAFLFQGIAGVIGCIIAAFVLQETHPKYAFLGYAIMGFIVGVSCIFLSHEAEREYLPGEEPDPTEFSSELLEG